ALHRPHPRRYLLHALLTPMPWRLDIHHLFARTEQYFYRPPPSKLSHYPVGTRLEIGRKQITIIHPALEVPHYHDLDRTQPQHSRPDRLVADHRQAATLSVHGYLDGTPQPRPQARSFPVGLGRCFPRLGQPRPLLGLG